MNAVFTIIMGALLGITLFLLIYILRKIPKSQIQQIFAVNLILIFECCFFVLLQLLLSGPLNIKPIYFDYLAYIGCCFLPVSAFFTALIFANTKIKFKKKYISLFIIPIISLLVLWTNDIHHWFYEYYSINLNECVKGPYLDVHIIYSYILFAISICYFAYYSIRNSGFFSKQSLLIVTGTMIPLIINVLGTYSIIPMTVYMTPITFSVAIILFTFAIFKFQLLSVNPIALQKIVDQISDSYVVLNEENCITDYNKTFIDTFHLKNIEIRNTNLRDLLEMIPENDMDINTLLNALDEARKTRQTIHLQEKVTPLGKYFNIEVSAIYSNGNFLGGLCLLKDITEHTLDMQTIEKNQNLLMERERLASLGQLIGGIAHNLKTPIMSISGATEGLKDLINEYDTSIEDPTVNYQDHHDIAREMMEWVNKIKEHTAYMSDIITTVKGQAVAMSGEDKENFTVDELIKKVNILMKHELGKSLIELKVLQEIPSSLIIKGSVNSLVQVVNNMISNAIQAYNGKTGECIYLILKKDDKNIIISIKDNGSGLPEKVQEKLFKEMITTKGKNGTGLGLFMSYSTIRAHFNGNINFESEEGKGTTFNISIPI